MVVAVGTEKGAWFFHPEERRLEGPVLPGWRVTAFTDTAAGGYLLATGSNWFGATIHRSADLTNWAQTENSPSWPEGGDRSLTQIWTFARNVGRIYAGVDQAGLFTSDDDGASWQPVDGINEHRTREAWQPGFGGLALHSILIDPHNADRIWIGISAVGVFRSEDGGMTWTPANSGVEKAATDEQFDDIGYCVHKIQLDPDDANRLYRQDHRGVYRSPDGGRTWEKTETGLPSSFGFPMVIDRSSKALFIVPLASDEQRLPVEGKFRVYRSTNRSDSWEVSGTGHPEPPTYTQVLRGAMDANDNGAVVYGTTAGTVGLTRDGGDSWETMPWTLPRILAVSFLPA
jgi:photosystem II stability/assembly factor-like uncharacterized protein